MAADEIFVGQIKGRRIDRTGDHARWIRKKVLVVGRLSRAVSDHQGRLAAAPSAATALRVIRRRGRHIPHIDRVESRNIHAEFHGRRAEQNRQAGRLHFAFDNALAR